MVKSYTILPGTSKRSGGISTKFRVLPDLRLSKKAFATVANPSPTIMRSTLLKTAFLAGLAGSAQAQTNWTGAASQDWTNAANWSAGVPGINSKATVNVATGNFVQITTAVNKSATVGGNDFWIGNGAGTSGRVDINNGGSLNTNAAWMFVGNGGGSGIFNVNSGGSYTTDNDVRFGAGSININGGTFTAARIVGNVGQLNVSGAGSLTTTSAGTANGSPDLQNLAVSSFTGSISAARSANFRNGATSDMSGGSITTLGGGEIRIGNSGSHTFTQSGGSISTAAWMVVGIGAGGNGTFNMSAGSVTSGAVNTGAFTTIGAGGGTGVVNQSGGTWTDGNKTMVGENAGGTGTFNLNGGTLATGRVETGAGTGNLNLNGGVLKALRNETNFISANTTVNVQSGGAKIDTNGFNVTTAANLTGTGSLEKQGAGTLTLSGNGNSVGSILVSAGTLYVTGALTSSGTVSVTGTGSIGSGDAGSGITGNVNIADGGTLDITQGLLTLGSGTTLSFGGFDFGDIIGFDVNTAALGTHTLVLGDFTLDSTNLAHFGANNALELGGGRSAYFTQGSLAVVVVPEPGVALLGSIGLLALLRRRRIAG